MVKHSARLRSPHSIDPFGLVLASLLVAAVTASVCSAGTAQFIKKSGHGKISSVYTPQSSMTPAQAAGRPGIDRPYTEAEWYAKVQADMKASAAKSAGRPQTNRQYMEVRQGAKTVENKKVSSGNSGITEQRTFKTEGNSEADKAKKTKGDYLERISRPAGVRLVSMISVPLAESRSPYIRSLDPNKFVYTCPRDDNEYLDRVRSASVTSRQGATQNVVPGAKIENNGREFTQAESEGILNVHDALPSHLKGLCTYTAVNEPGSAGMANDHIFINYNDDGILRTALDTQCMVSHELGHVYEEHLDVQQRAEWADIWNDSVAKGRRESSYPCRYAQNNFADNLKPQTGENGDPVYDGFGRPVYISKTDRHDDGSFKTCSGGEMLSCCNEYYMTDSHAFTQQAIETARDTGDDTLLRSASFIAAEVYGVNNKGAGALGHDEVASTHTYIFRTGVGGGMESTQVALKTVTVNGRDYQVPDYPRGW